MRGTPAGYAELERRATPSSSSRSGCCPAFLGRGLGTRLLDAALRRAWELGPRRVWVHTCSLDGPAALPTYRGRRLEVYDERTRAVALPAEPLEPWPGGGRPRPVMRWIVDAST